MRVLVLAAPVLTSHLYVQVPLIWALTAAGHDVRVAHEPDLSEAVRSAGLTGIEFGGPMADVLEEVDDEHAPIQLRPADPFRMPRQEEYAAEGADRELADVTDNLFRSLCPDEMIDDLVRVARAFGPDLVIWDQICFAGAVAAQACGAAHARLLFGTDGVTQLREAAGLDMPGRADPLRAWLEPLLHRYGSEFRSTALTGDWTIDTMPDWTWRPPGADVISMRHVPYNGPSSVPAWLQKPPEKPRVCLTLGLSHRTAGVAEASAAELLAGVADLDVEVVATLDRDQLGDTPVPDNVRLVDFVPLNDLLPTCSAVVHQGGSGTFACAVAHAVPQLIVPSSYWSDRWYGTIAQANALEDEGAGQFVCGSDDLTPAVLRSRLARVLDDPTFTAAAASLRDRTETTPTPARIAERLAELVAGHASRP